MPEAGTSSALANFPTEASAVPGGREPVTHQLARLQVRALVNAGYLEQAACRLEPDAVRAWWADVLPKVTAIHDQHNQIFAALAEVRAQAKAKAGQRTDPITCPLCGRPAPRGATYCVWCGRWLAAPRI